MTKEEIKQALELRGISTWIQAHRNSARWLYYTALKSPKTVLNDNQRSILMFLREKYKRQLAK